MVWKWVGKLIDGKSDDAPSAVTPPASVEPVDDPNEADDESGFVVFSDNGDIEVRAKTADQAQIALKELKLRKKELGVMKREVAAEARDLRAAATDKNRRRGPAMRGGGSFGRFVRGMDAAGKAGDRQKLAKNLAPHEAQRARLDQMILAVDRAIVQVESYLIKNA